MMTIRHSFSASSPIGMVLTRLMELDREGFTAARRDIGAYLVNDVHDNIDAQRLFDGSPMPRSKASMGGTFRRRIKSGKRKGKLRTLVVAARKTLLDRGHLRDSYTYNLTNSGVEVGSNLVYARIHHFGGKTGKGHKVYLPPRPVLGIGPNQAGRIGRMLLQEVRAVIQAAGPGATA